MRLIKIGFEELVNYIGDIGFYIQGVTETWPPDCFDINGYKLVRKIEWVEAQEWHFMLKTVLILKLYPLKIF